MKKDSDHKIRQNQKYCNIGVPLSAKILETLPDLAEMGDVMGIREYLTELGQSDEAFVPFARKFQQLAKTFRLNNITQLLKEYLK